MDARRRLVVAAPLAVFAPASRAQAGRIRRIGFMGNSTPALEANLVGPFRQGLRELGYVEGTNLTIEYRWAEGDYTRFPALVADLAKLRVESNRRGDAMESRNTGAGAAAGAAAPAA